MIPKEDCWKGRDWGGTQGKESSSIGGTSRGLSFGSRGGSERGEGPEIGGGGAPGVHAGGDAGTKRGRGGGGARPGRGGPALAKRGGRCPRQGGGWWDKAGETPPPRLPLPAAYLGARPAAAAGSVSARAPPPPPAPSPPVPRPPGAALRPGLPGDPRPQPRSPPRCKQGAQSRGLQAPRSPHARVGDISGPPGARMNE